MVERILLAVAAIVAALAVLNRDRWLARLGTQKDWVSVLLGLSAVIAFGASVWMSVDDHQGRTRYCELLMQTKAQLDSQDVLVRRLQLQSSLQALPTKADASMPTNRSETAGLNSTQKLAFGLLARLVADSATKNVVVSPVSVEMCLALAANGAAGKTKSEIAGLLGTSAVALDAVNEANAAMLATLAGSSGPAELTIANSVWGRKGVEFTKPFMDVCSQDYSASAKTLDFASPAAVREINDWVARRTRGLIRTMVDSINAKDVAFMLNAVHFQCRWAQPFDPGNTSARPFHLFSGSRVERQMMMQHGDFGYLETSSFLAVALLFVHNRFCLYVFVPRAANGLPSFVSKLSDDNWQTWISGFHTEYVNLGLPRFRLEYETDLKASLTAMGMTTAFNPSHADFTPMVAKSPLRPVWLSGAKHKVFVEVDEEGARAAATSGFGEYGADAEPRDVVVDRPFLFAITDTWSGAMLFMGVVYDPPQ